MVGVDDVQPCKHGVEYKLNCLFPTNDGKVNDWTSL